MYIKCTRCSVHIPSTRSDFTIRKQSALKIVFLKQIKAVCKQRVPTCACRILTPRVAESRFSGFASVAALVGMEGCALLPAASHHLHVSAEILGLSQSLKAVQLPAAGVRQVERLAQGIHRQVILMSRTGAVRGRACKTKLGNTYWQQPCAETTLQSKSIPEKT